MKLQIATPALRSGIARVADAAKSGKTLPILSNVLLDASTGILTLSASNLDQFSRVSLPCEVKEPGSTTLPCGRLSEIVGRVNGEEVSLSVDGKDVATLVSN